MDSLHNSTLCSYYYERNEAPQAEKEDFRFSYIRTKKKSEKRLKRARLLPLHTAKEIKIRLIE